MTSHVTITTTASITTFSPAEQQALETLRASYPRDPDLFSEKERAHLRFLRWLYQSGRLAP
jgi:hypothetical protein